MNQRHYLPHSGRGPEKCRRRPRRCLLKGCQRLYSPEHWRSRYCSEACRQAATRWRRWQACQRYRTSAKGQQRRREQSRRYRQRIRQRQAASAEAAAPREGQRIFAGTENSAEQPCDRPGCYQLFPVAQQHLCKRFCSLACRLALRCVLDREARYRARRRCWRRQRPARSTPPPDTS